jgi:VCBS repeat-containing protein
MHLTSQQISIQINGQNNKHFVIGMFTGDGES